MKINNIYSKYCSDMQNPALGAYILSTFVKSYNENSKSKANLFILFLIMPMIMRESIRKLIVTNSYRKPHKILAGLIKTLCSGADDDKVFGILHDNITNYKEYTMTSLIFALRLGILKIDSNAELEVPVDIHSNPSVFACAATVLGKMFATGDLSNFISYTGIQV